MSESLIRYTLTQQEFLSAYGSGLARLENRRFWIFGVVGLGVIAIALGYWPLALIFPMGVLLFYAWVRVCALRVFRRDDRYSRDTSLSYSVEAIVVETGQGRNQTRFEWDYFQVLRVTRRVLVLETARQEMLIIPKRAFIAPDAMAAFLQVARAKIATAG